MMRSPRKGPPKHLEKMLFINHKEDMLLIDRLADLNLRSKLRSMDLDRERIQVRRELRNSQKRNIDVRDASALGLVNASAPGKSTEIQKTTKPVKRKHAISAPPGGRLSMISEKNSENPSTAETTESAPRLLRRQSYVNRLSREFSLPDIHETFDESDEHDVENSSVQEILIPRREVPIPIEKQRANSLIKGRSRANSIIDESVGAYVLGEFRRMSQVVPSILRALNNKDEEEEEELLYQTEVEQPVSLLDYEPDLHKVTKTVRAVKKLRHRMSVSKKLDAARPTKSLDQMIKEKTDNIGVQDEYTDGACVLMKRRLDKKRRNSAIPGLSQPAYMQRRQSLFAKPESSEINKTRTVQTGGLPNLPRQRNRSQSVFNLPKISRCPTVIGLSNTPQPGDNFDSPVIDEDEFLNRQKVLRELDNYRRISAKVGEFLTAHDSRRRAEQTRVYAI